jgi:hypothetical protein
MITVSNIASIATAVGIFVLVFQVFLQYKDQHNQSIFKLLDEFERSEIRNEMRFLFSREPEDFSLEKLNAEESKMVNNVIARFDALAFKIKKGLVPKKIVVESYFDWIIRCGQQTRVFVNEQRAKRLTSEKYKLRFEWLVKECKLFQLKRENNEDLSRGKSFDELLTISPLPVFKPLDKKKEVKKSRKKEKR